MENERTPAILTHVLGILTSFIGPLVMYLALRKKASPWLRSHLDEAVNSRILVVAAFLLLMILALVFTAFGLPGVSLTLALLAIAIFLASIVLSLVATVKAARGKEYRFPVDVKIVR